MGRLLRASSGGNGPDTVRPTEVIVPGCAMPAGIIGGLISHRVGAGGLILLGLTEVAGRDRFQPGLGGVNLGHVGKACSGLFIIWSLAIPCHACRAVPDGRRQIDPVF